ncbi:TIGR02186 family protein [Sphingosinicella rhizophila]|uniref:TIGR02186 family protein n=1 Tax=Sphingosinicella rhizophila TaxID=3050082 RepID=A0ABU3Q8F1_9SPHN|nr:TIGR02186 family protein [Sphingosinicella sp. GR2756]MDT9599677.1 TIGR02186 family protein [Sphingosinicella sp. GR2756]
MRFGIRCLLLPLLASLLLGAAEPKLVPDVSQRNVEIRYSFTGAELLLFGAILYPGGRVPEHGADVAVVVKGPLEPIVVREKKKVAGIWMNVESARFRSAPAFYAVASSRPLRELVDERMAAIYELGLGNIQLSPSTGAPPDVQRRFETGFIDLMQRRQLYLENPKGVEISEGVLYRARLNIPARVPVGDYTAETFLIRDGRVVAGAVREIRIEKLGFERWMANAAEHWSFAYGLAAVLLSLLLGWGASAIANRR